MANKETGTQENSNQEQEELTAVRESFPVLERSLFVLSAIVNLATWLVVLIAVPYSVDQYILHYNIYFGVDLSGPWWRLLLPPAVGSISMFINSFGLRAFTGQHRAMRSVVYSITVLLQVLLLVGVLLLLSYN